MHSITRIQFALRVEPGLSLGDRILQGRFDIDKADFIRDAQGIPVPTVAENLVGQLFPQDPQILTVADQLMVFHRNPFFRVATLCEFLDLCARHPALQLQAEVFCGVPILPGCGQRFFARAFHNPGELVRKDGTKRARTITATPDVPPGALMLGIRTGIRI